MLQKPVLIRTSSKNSSGLICVRQSNNRVTSCSLSIYYQVENKDYTDK